MNKTEKAPKAPKKAKKEKAAKAPKEKKVKKDKAAKDPSEKKKIPKIILIILPLILVLAVATVVVYMLFFRTPASPEEEIEKIVKKTDFYQVGSDQIASLESTADEGRVKRNSVERPVVDEETGEIENLEFTYHYREINGTPARLAADYIDVLRGEEQGFTLTDKEHHELEEEPNLLTEVGSVFLAKAATVEAAEPAKDDKKKDKDKNKDEDDAGEAGENGEDSGSGEDSSEAAAVSDKLVEVAVVWSESAIAVRVAQRDGTILPPVVEEDPATVEREPLALKTQLEYFNNLAPEKLGLSGDFMSEYRVYPVDGLVRVSGVTCRVLNVYLMDLPAETNTFMGTYYLSTDNTQIFKLDDNGTIVSLNME